MRFRGDASSLRLPLPGNFWIVIEILGVSGLITDGERENRAEYVLVALVVSLERTKRVGRIFNRVSSVVHDRVTFIGGISSKMTLSDAARWNVERGDSRDVNSLGGVTTRFLCPLIVGWETVCRILRSSYTVKREIDVGRRRSNEPRSENRPGRKKRIKGEYYSVLRVQGTRCIVTWKMISLSFSREHTVAMVANPCFVVIISDRGDLKDTVGLGQVKFHSYSVRYLIYVISHRGKMTGHAKKWT